MEEPGTIQIERMLRARVARIPQASALAQFTSDLSILVMLLVPMMLSAAAVAGLIHLAARAEHWQWQHWMMASPVLYLGWLIVFLLTSAVPCLVLGRMYPKPRYAVYGVGLERSPKRDLALLTNLMCYRRYLIVKSLPLIEILEQLTWFRILILHAYSPSVNIGRSVVNYGRIIDPDLTQIGDNVIIGGGSVVLAHSATTRQDGATVFVSAPVKIGHGATIGGGACVTLGCVIGDDSIVEQGAFVTPYTRIPPGEVWGGNPACFRRYRDHIGAPEADRLGSALGGAVAAVGVGTVTAVGVGTVAPPSAQVDAADPAGAGPHQYRQLVIDALSLPPDEVPDVLSSETCPSWDSLGQVAIAAAIHDRYGIAVDTSEAFRIRTLEDVADLVAAHKPATAQAATVRSQAKGEAALAVEAAPAGGLPDDLLPLLDPGEATQALSMRFQGVPATGQPLRVVVAASFIAQPMATALKLWGKAYGFELDCQFAGYDQIAQTLLDEDGPFAANRDGVNVILTRPEDLASEPEDGAEAQLDQLLDAVAHFASRELGSGQTLVGTLPPVASAFALLDKRRTEFLRNHWRTRLDAMTGVELFDFAHLVERLGSDNARDSKAEVLTRTPYSPRLYQELGIALARQIRAKRRSPAKVIAVDCDNTLWGGVVGEVEPDGIQLGPDGPGRSFQLFQRHLKHLKDRGLLLVVVSRNEERDVREVFAHHPEMVLRPDDIVAWRVNWNHKSQSLRELADELNLGLDSFVFLDDDPAVRMEVETRLPEVHVVPLPHDSAFYCETLARLWLFDGAEATEVDAARTRMMHEENRRQHEQQSAASLGEYLASLQLQVEITPPTEQDWTRIAQLTQRTNQFNLSLKRRTVEEVRALRPAATVLVLRAGDRFGDYGLVGACILRAAAPPGTWELDTLLMSCRVMGRGVEDAFLHGIARVATQRGADILLASYVDGPRNGQVKDFLDRSGFAETAPNAWTRSLVELPPLPGHVELHLAADESGGQAKNGYSADQPLETALLVAR